MSQIRQVELFGRCKGSMDAGLSEAKIKPKITSKQVRHEAAVRGEGICRSISQ
jgi:hypothetical protein